MPKCRQLRQYDAVSIAAGTQAKVLECENDTTEKVYVNGKVRDMCQRCASEAIKEFNAVEIKAAQERDAAQLRQYAGIMAHGVSVWSDRPEVASWFNQCAEQLETMAVAVLEGNL